MTLRELFVMYQARVMEGWDKSSRIEAGLYNIFAKRRTHWIDCHPYRLKSKSSSIPIDRSNIDVLAGAFLMN